jgi:hypothetical protein
MISTMLCGERTLQKEAYEAILTISNCIFNCRPGSEMLKLELKFRVFRRLFLLFDVYGQDAIG